MDAQVDSGIKDTMSRVVTISPGAGTGDVSTDSDAVNEPVEAANLTFSSGSLENNLKQLESNWRAVEQAISGRDKQIRALESALDGDRQTISKLEADLDAMSSKHSELSDQLDTAEREINAWRAKCDAFEHDLQSRDADLQQVQNRHDLLLEGNKELEKELDQHRSDSAAGLEATNVLQTKNVEYRAQIQELQDYIDGRKLDWEKMQSQAREYELAIKGMSESLEAHEEIVAGKEEEKAALALTVMNLERDLAALKGRQSEREANRVGMQKTLDRQSRELGSLSSGTAKLNAKIDELQRELDASNATVHRLQREHEEQNAIRKSLEVRLAAEEPQLDDTASPGGHVEKPPGSSGIPDSELQQQLVAAEMRLAEASDKAAAEEIRAIELDGMLSEIQAEHRMLEKEVQAQRELIEVLETEAIGNQQRSPAPDSNVDCLSAIGSKARDLDLMVDDRWHQQPASLFDDSEDLFEFPDDMFEAAEGSKQDDIEPTKPALVAEHADPGMEIRYPLIRDEMTVGRSRDSDIRLHSKYISRIHARIKVNGGDVLIEDAGSMNGFLVNSIQSTRHRLTDGDTIEFGLEKFRYIAPTQVAAQ